MAVLGWTVADIRTSARRLFQERTAQRIDDADILRWANEGAEFIAGATRSLRSSATASSVTAEDTYAIATSAIASWAITRVEYNGEKLEESPWEKKDEHIGTGTDASASGTPKVWSPYGDGYIVLTPPPDAANVIEQWFEHLPDAMVNDGDALPIANVYAPPLLQYILSQGLYLLGERQLALESFKIFLQMLQMVNQRLGPNIAPEVARGS